MESSNHRRTENTQEGLRKTPLSPFDFLADGEKCAPGAFVLWAWEDSWSIVVLSGCAGGQGVDLSRQVQPRLTCPTWTNCSLWPVPKQFVFQLSERKFSLDPRTHDHSFMLMWFYSRPPPPYTYFSHLTLLFNKAHFVIDLILPFQTSVQCDSYVQMNNRASIHVSCWPTSNKPMHAFYTWYNRSAAFCLTAGFLSL